MKGLLKAAIEGGKCNNCDLYVNVAECNWCEESNKPNCRIDCTLYFIPEVCKECLTNMKSK